MSNDRTPCPSAQQLSDLPPELAASSKYEVLSKLGEGGMGAVWKARHAFLGEMVAIKVMNSLALSNPDARNRFLREMRAVGQLKNKNIVRALDAEEIGGLLVLVMEYVEGITLDRLVEQKGMLPVAFSCHCIVQAALGLQYAHEKSMVHRDIKPGNLIVATKERSVKLLDFGLARGPREHTAQMGHTAKDNRTQAGAVMGTPAYMAPEQATDASSVDIRADVYSLGCTLYFLLAGQSPFEKGSAFTTMMAQVEEQARPLTELRSDVSAELWAVMAKMLAKKPEDRFQTPKEVEEALRPFTTGGAKSEQTLGGAKKAALFNAATLMPGNASELKPRSRIQPASKVSDDDRTLQSQAGRSQAGRSQAGRSQDRNREEEPDLGRRSRRSRREKSVKSNKSLVPILVCVGVGAFVLIGLVVGGLVWALSVKSNTGTPVAAVTEQSAAPIAAADAPEEGNEAAFPMGIVGGPTPGSGLKGDLAALKGTWQSGDVNADRGGATGSVKLQISPGTNQMGGRVKLEISTKQAGRTSSSTSTHRFTLSQRGGARAIVATGLHGFALSYTFDGGQLIVSGKVSSRQFSYTLGKVVLQRTSASPGDLTAGNSAPAPSADGGGGGGKPAAGGGGGKPAADAIKINGDVNDFVQSAVQENRLVDVDIRGFRPSEGDKDKYRDVCAEGGVLIGFQVALGRFGKNVILKAWRPIFITKNAEKFGKWQGEPTPTERPITVKAKPGYVVSGMAIRAQLLVDGFTLAFARLGKDGLDLSDTYNSVQVGGEGGSLSSIGGTGALFVGITGYLGHDKTPCALGLVAVQPKE